MPHNNRGRRGRRNGRGPAPASTPAAVTLPEVLTTGVASFDRPYETTGIANLAAPDSPPAVHATPRHDPPPTASIRDSATLVNAPYVLDPDSDSDSEPSQHHPANRFFDDQTEDWPEDTTNGVETSPLFARLGRAPLPCRKGEEFERKGDIAVLHIEDEGIWSADIRLQAVSLGFAISVGLPGINARAMYASNSTDSIVDYRFVHLVGLLAKMVPLRPVCDKVELREVGTKREYKVYGQVDVPFVAGRWEFKVPCWVVDVAAPVEVVLGHDWLREYRVELSTSLEGQKIVDVRRARLAAFAMVPRDEYVELA